MTEKQRSKFTLLVDTLLGRPIAHSGDAGAPAWLVWTLFWAQGAALVFLLTRLWAAESVAYAPILLVVALVGLALNAWTTLQVVDLFPHGGGVYHACSKWLGPPAGMIWGVSHLVQQFFLLALVATFLGEALLPKGVLPYASWFMLLGLVLPSLRGVRTRTAGAFPILALGLFSCLFMLMVLNGLWDQGSRLITDLPIVMDQNILTWLPFVALAWAGFDALGHVLRERASPKLRETQRGVAIHVVLSIVLLVVGVFWAPWTGGWNLIHDGLALGQSRAFAGLAAVGAGLLVWVSARETFGAGSRTLAQLALDGWMPRRFALLSERLVSQNGVLFLGAGAGLVLIPQFELVQIAAMLVAGILVTSMSAQAAMLAYWLAHRRRSALWLGRVLGTGVGLLFHLGLVVLLLRSYWTSLIWVLVAWSLCACVAVLIWRNYRHTLEALARLDRLAQSAQRELDHRDPETLPTLPTYEVARREPTAILVVQGFDGMGIHTFLTISRLFRSHFKNVLFVRAGLLDAGNYKGPEDLARLQTDVERDLDAYGRMMRNYGIYSEGFGSVGTDLADEVQELVSQAVTRFPKAVVFSGSLLFKNETVLTRMLHNEHAFALEKRLHYQGIPFLVMPIRVDL